MGSHSILKMQMESCRKRVAELEDEIRKLRGQLLAIRDWLEEVESQHAVLSPHIRVAAGGAAGGGEG